MYFHCQFEYRIDNSYVCCAEIETVQFFTGFILRLQLYTSFIVDVKLYRFQYESVTVLKVALN
jgi:hypothetical protein